MSELDKEDIEALVKMRRMPLKETFLVFIYLLGVIKMLALEKHWIKWDFFSNNGRVSWSTMQGEALKSKRW